MLFRSVNLETRPDRLEDIKFELNYIGWDYEVFKAVNRNSYMGCTLSHLGIINIAKERGYKRVMVIEDDCDVMPYAKSFIEDLEKQIVDIEFGVMNLAPTLNRPMNISEKYNLLLDLTNLPPKPHDRLTETFATNILIYDVSSSELIESIKDYAFHSGDYVLPIDEQLVNMAVYYAFGASNGITKSHKDEAYADKSLVWEQFQVKGIPASNKINIIAFTKARTDRQEIPAGSYTVSNYGQIISFRNVDLTPITTAAYGSIPIIPKSSLPSGSVRLTNPIYISVANSTSFTKITPTSLFLGTPGSNNITIDSSGTKFNTRGSYLQTFINGRGITISSLQEEDGQVVPEAALFFANSSVLSIGNNSTSSIVSSEEIISNKLKAGTTEIGRAHV